LVSFEEKETLGREGGGKKGNAVKTSKNRRKQFSNPKGLSEGSAPKRDFPKEKKKNNEGEGKKREREERGGRYCGDFRI